MSRRERKASKRGRAVQPRVWDVDEPARDASYRLTGETPTLTQRPQWQVRGLRNAIDQALTPDENVQE